MKYLTVDDQTISDLSIFAKSGKNSVYALYNKTCTQGGEAKLKELFLHPLSDEIAINERSAIYNSFSIRPYVFPVDPETINTLTFYMENDDVRSQLQVANESFGQAFKKLIAADSDYVFVNDGVQACLRLFYKLSGFIRKNEQETLNSPYAPHLRELKELIYSDSFLLINQHVSSKSDTRLSTGVLAELDRLIRFTNRESILRVLDLLYDLDICICVGQIARENKFAFAKAMPASSGVLNYGQVYHPHVTQAIANNLVLNDDHNVLFLTGANMAGKSTLMKSVGIALYLGHMGFPVAAAHFEFPVKDGIFTSINLADNLSAGASHYYAEVLRVKEVAKELSEGKRLFVIFDELFRGTNVKDAYDATIALTTAFCKKRSSHFIISTHIMEAGESLKQKHLPIKYQYLPTEMKGSTPVYPRILKEGITADRQGMLIIENEGILEMLDAGIIKMEE